MAIDSQLDDVDWRILAELQQNARLSFAELGRRVALSAPAVADRVRNLEARGVIQGYRAELNLERLGRPILAFVRVRCRSGDHRPFEKAIRDRPQILECHHVTGEDCFVVKVAACSMRDLEQIVGHLARLGSTTTSLVFSTLIDRRVIGAPADTSSVQLTVSASSATRRQ